MASVLLVSYPFPPSGTVGVSRALAYVRYLRLHGCDVSVLTATSPQTSGYDADLGRSIPGDVRVYRAWNPELPFALRDRAWKRLITTLSGRVKEESAAPADHNRSQRRWIETKIRSVAQRLLFPDPQTTWVPFATRKALKIIRSDGVDTVIMNVPPFSTLKIGIALKRAFPKIRIVTDFRDEWLDYYLSQIDDPTTNKIRLAEKLEQQIVSASSYVSTVTPEWVRRLRRRYPAEPPNKFIYTPNGYEPEIFDGFRPRMRTDGKMLITYFGSVHTNRVYSPKNYLAAIEGLPSEVREQILTRFIGRVRPDAEACLKQTKANVEQLGFMPKIQGLHFLEETDFLLLIAADATSHAAKLFDYLPTGKPILALSSPTGEIAKLLRETRTGWCADACNQRAIQQMLLQAWNRLNGSDGIVDPDWQTIRSYSWPEIFRNFVRQTGIHTEPHEPGELHDSSTPFSFRG